MNITVTKTRNGYKVLSGNFSTVVTIGKEAGGIRPLNAETSFGKEKLVYLEGSVVADGEITRFDSITVFRGVSKSAGLRGIGVLLYSAEHALRERGVKLIRGRTHAGFARFAKEFGYPEKGIFGTSVDLEKDLGRTKPVLPRRFKAIFAKKQLARARRLPR